MSIQPEFVVGKILKKRDCVQGVGRFDSLKGVKKGSGWLRDGTGAMIEARFLSVGEAMGTGIFESADQRAAMLEAGNSYPYFSELTLPE
jgi:hypothetical protein